MHLQLAFMHLLTHITPVTDEYMATMAKSCADSAILVRQAAPVGWALATVASHVSEAISG